MYCGKCGALVVKKSKFCGRCGVEVIFIPSQTESIKIKDEKINLKWILVSVGFVIAIAILLIALLNVRNQSGIAMVSAGSSHTIVLKEDGTVWAWGSNHGGQLGDGTVLYSSVPIRIEIPITIIAVCAGNIHSLALDEEGNVWAWGLKWRGELGVGDTYYRLHPTRISSLSGISAISAGGTHSLALDNRGTVWAWGSNSRGLLGNGNTVDSNIPIPVVLGPFITAISAGYNHNLALCSNGTVYAWGENNVGQLGISNNDIYPYENLPVRVSRIHNITAISASGSGGVGHSLALDQNGNVWSWGPNPQLIQFKNRIIAISAGSAHGLAVDSRGNIYAWGSNNSGQLGTVDFPRVFDLNAYKDTPYRLSEAENMMATSRGLHHISAGGCHSVIITKEGYLWAWGRNCEGQLGNGITEWPEIERPRNIVKVLGPQGFGYFNVSQ